MLSNSSLRELNGKKNLLAFSGGADSTALFHLLFKNNISFDIIHINYNTRSQSILEEQNALVLAKDYNLNSYIKSVKLEEKNFESEARKVRYDFFHSIINEHGYNNLITAHHLGDRLEWFLMQLCSGSGVYELLGMKEVEHRDNYTLVRPLLHVDKSELINYLNKKQLSWFEDESNMDESIKRNYFRHNFSNPLLEKYSKNIAKSFEYIEDDLDLILEDISITCIKELRYFKTTESKRSNIIAVDHQLKKDGFLMRRGDKEELKTSDSVVVGRRYVVCTTSIFTFITPYVKTVMDKEFKERCRVLKIESKLRGYLFENMAVFKEVENLLLNLLDSHGKR